MDRRDDAGVDTGRLKTALAAEAQRIVYGRYNSDGADELGSELTTITEIDRAHLVMLAEEEIVHPGKVKAILQQIDALRSSQFRPVRERPIPRGVYLAYESYLSEALGDKVAGVVHTGRLRNDLNAATVKLRARAPCAALVAAAVCLCDVLLEKAEQHKGVVMPAYTHGQAAVPVTYGHYLTGLACSVIRDIENFMLAGEELDTNPLGAGAVGGTSVPINARRTSGLLGFTRPTVNSVDAVASRDYVLQILSATAILGVGLTRAAHDIALWTTEEFGFLRLPDDLVGSSSMMPQKRNPFLLEHVQGKAASRLGSFVSAVAAMSTAGYTNAIAVGTKGTAHLWSGLKNATEAMDLLRLVMDGAIPVESRMLERVRSGNTVATYFAELLVRRGIAFRVAHYQVGKMVREALDRGEYLSAQSLGDALDETGPDRKSLEPAAVVRASKYGGGPGEATPLRRIGKLKSDLVGLRAVLAGRQERWETGRLTLNQAVQHILRSLVQMDAPRRSPGPADAGAAASSIMARAAERWQAIDPLLPAPERLSPACDAGLLMTGQGALSAAMGACEHWAATPESSDLSWGAARRFQLTVRAAGPDVAAPLDQLLSLWGDHLARVPGTGAPDTVAVVAWPSRDIDGTATLLRHGLVPLAVVAVRETGRRRTVPGRVAAPRPGDGNGSYGWPGDMARTLDPGRSGPRIRRAGPGDIGAVVRLGLDVLQFDAHFSPLTERPGTADALWRQADSLLAGPDVWTWLAERDGTPIGMLSAQRPEAAVWITPMVRPAPAAYTALLDVLPGERGSGVGQALVACLHREAEAAGVAVTLLRYEQLNPLAVPFWSRQGYRPLWTLWETRPARAIR